MDIYEIANKAININIYLTISLLGIMYLIYLLIFVRIIYLKHKIKYDVLNPKKWYKFQLWSRRYFEYTKYGFINFAIYIAFSFITIAFQKALIATHSPLVKILWFKIFFINIGTMGILNIHIINIVLWISFKLFIKILKPKKVIDELYENE